MATRDLLAVAERNAAHAAAVLAKRKEIAERSQQLASEYDGGNGKSVKQLAEDHGVSQETVRSGLKAAGVYTPQNRAKLDELLKASIVQMLREDITPAEAAKSTGVSQATVRKLGLAAGVLKKGPARKVRTEEEFDEIAQLDEDVRGIHGAGLLALGVALANHRKQAKVPTSGGVPVTEEVIAKAVEEAEAGHELSPPIVAEPPAEDTPPW